MEKVDYFSRKDVDSDRVLYTPSVFARTSLLHLQEIGSLRALKRHVSRRQGLASYLFIIVEAGAGKLFYRGAEQHLSKGDCVFIDCNENYAHETSENLWKLKWAHFFGPQMGGIYKKYEERGGKAVFKPENVSGFERIWAKLFEIANSDDYIRDMRINEGLSELLTLLMEESRQPDEKRLGKKRKDLVVVCDYLNENYAEKISLDELAERFYINKFYLTRVFKKQYGISINRYLLQVRLTKAKQLLRFSEETVENVGWKCGLGAAQYFAKIFKREEGLSPSEFRRKWKF